MNNKRIKLLVVDDHPVVRKGLSFALSSHRGLEIVGEASGGVEAVRKARELAPDIVLMDVEMPGMSGLSAAEELRKELPQIKVLFLSAYRNAEYVQRGVQSGAHGYLLKEAAAEDLVRAIEAVAGGQDAFSSGVVPARQDPVEPESGAGPDLRKLNHREREVLIQIAEGQRSKQIAEQLGLEVRTVEMCRFSIMRKLKIHSVAGLTKFALAKGLLQLF